MNYKYPRISNTLSYERVDENSVEVIDHLTDNSFTFGIEVVRFVKKLDGYTHPYRIKSVLNKMERDDIIDFLRKYELIRSSNCINVSFGTNIRFHDLRHTYATILTNEEIDVKAISNSLGHSKTIITVDVYTDKKQMIVDVSEQTQEFACEIFPISYLQERQVEEANRTRFLKEIYYFPEQLAEEIMGIIL